MTAPRVLVAGVGNVFLGDDGFGCEVARRLFARALPEAVCVADFGIRAFDLGCALLDGPEAVILVDAVLRGGPPGSLYVIEPLVRGAAETLDAHALTAEAAIALAAAMGGRMGTLRLIGCEPLTLDPELGLSPVVEAAVEGAVALALSLIAELTAARSGAAA